MEYLYEYVQAASDYELSLQRMLKYLQNILPKNTKCFYLEHGSNHVQTFQQVAEVVDHKYVYQVRWMCIENHFYRLRVSDFIRKGDNVTLSFTEIYRSVLKLSGQAPSLHCGKAYKSEFVRFATVGYPWSHEPLSRASTHGLRSQMLYGELEAAL